MKILEAFDRDDAAFLADIGEGLYQGWMGEELSQQLGLSPEEFISAKGVEAALFAGGGVTVLFFLGTNDLKDWLYNLSATKVCSWDASMLGEDLMVHSGYQAAFDVVRTKVVALASKYLEHHPKLVISGHSYGGSIGLLAALALAKRNPTVITFGAPRLAKNGLDTIFKKHRIQHIRIETVGDIIPHLPPARLGFRHSGNLIYLDETGAAYNSIGLLWRIILAIKAKLKKWDHSSHSLATYSFLLKKGAHND